MKSNYGGKGGYAAATMSIALVLLLLGAVGYFLVNANTQSKNILANVGFSIMLNDYITSEQKTVIEQHLTGDPVVKEFKFLSKNEAAQEFKEYLKADFEALLDANPLPASYELVLNTDADNDGAILELEKRAMTWNGVSMVLYQQKMTKTVMDSLRRVNLILLGFGAVLLGISIMLIYNTLRLDVSVSSETIRTMKLVGAKNSFIRRPFILRSLTQGALAGIISSAVLYFLIDGIAAFMPEINFVRDLELLAVIFCAMIATGIIICTLFTRLALNKYIKL